MPSSRADQTQPAHDTEPRPTVALGGEPIDLLITAPWIVPIEPEGVVLERHAVAVRDGLIVDLLPAADARQRYVASQIVDRPGHVLLPGLVNAHTHAAMNLLRGLADDLPLMTWLQEHIWPAEQANVSATFVEDGVMAACAEMLAGGITTFNDMYFFPEMAARVVDQAGMRLVAGMILIDHPSPYATHADDYLAKGLALHDAWREHPRISTAFAPHAPYTVNGDMLKRVAMLAAELDLGVQIHLHETADEVAQSLRETGLRPLQRLDQAGLLGPGLMAVHMTQLSDDDIARAASSGLSVIHCPESNLKLASGFCPVQRLLDAGVPLAIGTDGAASNNDLDLFGEMRTAALIGKCVAGDAAALPAEQVLHMATLGGARALGLDAHIGSLRPGKAADLIAVDLSGLAAQPVYHPISHLVYATGRHQVSDTWVAGRRLLADGTLTTLDRALIRTRLAEWAQRLQPDAGPL